MKKLVVLGGCVALLMLSACASRPSQREIRESGDYWQRSDSTSALYLTGPKAQHQLNMDIAACVAEVKELVRLGSIRSAQPPKDLALEPGLARGWDGPTHDGPLYTEYTDFQDFESCMNSKGWERIEYVKPVEAQRATMNFWSTILGHSVGRDTEFDQVARDANGYNK